ncbi:MAG: hypothetical protein L3J46_02530 [Kangiellaceae bacterium]|nr:hypothetical protein [Kangiellaceae bacterium]
MGNSSNTNIYLEKNWGLFKSSPDQFCSPTEIEFSTLLTIPAAVPGTVAMSVNGKAPNCWKPELVYDDFDWWYTLVLDSNNSYLSSLDFSNTTLCFDGLATLTEVWLNDKLLLKTENMFRSYKVPITTLKLGDRLSVVFRSTANFLKIKRPRPKWKTKLVDNQQLRWLRTCVLGRSSFWTPPITAIGPWKSIYLQSPRQYVIESCRITTHVNEELPHLSIDIVGTSLLPMDSSTDATIKINGHKHPLPIIIQDDKFSISEQLDLDGLDLWWPHTHGEPSLYNYEITVGTQDNLINIKSGRIGFKHSQWIADKNTTQIKINGVTIFCRGTCWSLSDYISLSASSGELRQLLTLMRDAGVNMIRVGGTMVYESDEFYGLCDELGILIWQDFMFASMDYPVDNEQFNLNITEEVSQQTSRLSNYSCIAIYCGNTDVEAQSAMYGIDKSQWSNSFFENSIPEILEQFHPGIPYISSSPSGGALPFHLSEGTSHYWGVGAYMLPTSDKNKERVKFASEGMGLSHIPNDKFITENFGKNKLFPYSNDFVYRVPRDLGAGWDFDTIRDFYIEDVFGINARQLKRQNIERYIEMSRVVTGEVISRVFEYWRSEHSSCNGGLIWFNRDFWPCAGFGIFDSDSQPKAAYYQLKRAWANRTVIIENSGLDGANITVVNDKQHQFDGALLINFVKEGKLSDKETRFSINIDGHKKKSFNLDEILGRFIDSGYAYKFGPPIYDILSCKLVDHKDKVVSESFMFREGLELPVHPKESVLIKVKKSSLNSIKITIESDVFLHFVRINAKNYFADENYFHLCPGHTKTITLNKLEDHSDRFRGALEALNLHQSIKIKLDE